MEKLCRKITSHILVCLSICLCAHSIAHKIHYNTGWTRSNTGSLKLNRKSNNWQYEKKSLWNFKWQESILEKWCRKITSHLLVCLSICLCACAFLCLFVNWTNNNNGSLKLNKKGNNWQYEKNSLWKFRWQESILGKLCRTITSHLLVCLSICLCAYAFQCLIVNKMHFQTTINFLCATFWPYIYFQHFLWKNTSWHFKMIKNIPNSLWNMVNLR